MKGPGPRLTALFLWIEMNIGTYIAKNTEEKVAILRVLNSLGIRVHPNSLEQGINRLLARGGDEAIAFLREFHPDRALFQQEQVETPEYSHATGTDAQVENPAPTAAGPCACMGHATVRFPGQDLLLFLVALLIVFLLMKIIK